MTASETSTVIRDTMFHLWKACVSYYVQSEEWNGGSWILIWGEVSTQIEVLTHWT